MHLRRLATHVEVQAPAKINLFLEVLGKRPDGYHEIETLIAAVSTYDTLTFSPTTDPAIRLDCRWALGLPLTPVRVREPAQESLFGEIPTGADNLVVRAATLLRERAGVPAGARIGLVKRIPAAAGLGGASSDAAATLLAANVAWNLAWPRSQLLELAAELGSDVPFFLNGKAAVCRGRGERIEPVAISRLPVVVVRPPVGLSTPQVYARCRPTTKPRGVAGAVAALAEGRTESLDRVLTNGLDEAAMGISPWIDDVYMELDIQRAVAFGMSGSGSSCFAVFRSMRHARRVAARLRGRGIGATFAAVTSGSCRAA